MKPKSKVLGVVCSVMLVIGLALMTVGFVSGARLDTLNWRWGRSDYHEIPAVKTVPPIADAPTISTTADEGVSLMDFSKSYDAQDISSLEISVEAGRLTLITSDEFRVEAANVSGTDFSASVDGGVLCIRDKLPRSFQSLINIRYEPEITVYVPAGFRADNATISVAAGVCYISGLQADYLDFTLSAGDLSVIDLNADQVNVTVAAGRGYFETFTAEHAEITVSAGEFEAVGMAVDFCDMTVTAGAANVSGSIREMGQFNCGVGRIGLWLDGTRDEYTATINVGLGSIQYGGERLNGITNKVYEGNFGDIDIFLDCGVGEIEVVFR